jgi:hypothetical protein
MHSERGIAKPIPQSFMMKKKHNGDAKDDAEKRAENLRPR